MGRKLEIEVGQSLVAFEAFTDEGNQQIFTPTAALMSSVVAPEVFPDGIATGVNLISPAASGSDDVVDVAAHTAYLGGTLYSFPAQTDVAITRDATDPYLKTSVVGYLNAGTPAVKVIAGTAHATAFSTTRGDAGAPEYIGVLEYEIGQVWTTATAAAAISDSEIKQNSQYTERYDSPTYDINPIGKGLLATETGTENAFVEFSSALDTRHTGDVTKGVYGQYYTPSFSRLTRVENFSPAANSHSISSTETFDGPVGSKSTSLGQASFSIRLKDGVNDLVLTQQDKNVLFKLYPEENASAHHITQGYLGVSESYDSNTATASCTITPEFPSVRFAA